MALATRRRSTSVDAGVHAGPQCSASSSTCGMAKRDAISRASAVLPEPVVPMTTMRRPGGDTRAFTTVNSGGADPGEAAPTDAHDQPVVDGHLGIDVVQP